MTLMEKFASLTPEQREKLDEVKDEATLVAFAAENNIELTEQDKKDALDYFENDVVPMSDDDMEAVAGGAAAKKSSPEKAKADGRTVPMPVMMNRLCNCHHDNKWARSKVFVRANITSTSSGAMETDTYRYEDVKCYKCGKQWEKCYI